jgi:hypothetical protein
MTLNSATPQTQVPFSKGRKVSDDAFPDEGGIVICAGVQQSEVMFANGVIRCRPNDCLHEVGAEASPAAAPIDTPPAPAADPVLAKYAAEIRRLAKRVKEDVIEIGRYLVEAREHIGHGGWLAWIDVEFGWSDQTARNFIQLYEAREAQPKFQNIWNSSLPVTALIQLAAPNTPDEARQEIADRIAGGEKPTVAVVKEVIAAAKDKAEEIEEPGLEPASRTGDGDADRAGDPAAEMILKGYFDDATGADIFDRIPAARRSEVVRDFLDRLTVQEMCAAMSPEFKAALHARLPAKRKPFEHSLNIPRGSKRGNHSRH